jgi:deazaflavin-dependent oxidoreductase (nitroreductase family)
MWMMVLAMMAGIVIVLIAGMATLLLATSHGSCRRQGGAQVALMGLVSNVVTWLLRMGVPVRIFGNPVVLLTVSGRKTGQPRTTLVDLYERDGRRFLVSTHGEDKAQWVHNLRATGKGTLTRGRRIQKFTAVELPPEVAGRTLKEILGPRLASPFGGYALRQTVEVTADAPLERFISAARHHPVFELRVASAVPSQKETGREKGRLHV